MRELGNISNGILDNQTPESKIQTIISRELSFINTIKLCKIIEIHENKTCVVQDLVSRITSGAAEMANDMHYEIYDCQEIGGNGGFVIERKIGDIIVVGFFDRESTQQLESARAGVLKSRAVCPNSSGVILGAVFYTTPTVNITINNNITLNGETEINGNIQANGDITSTGNISAPTGSIDTLTISGPEEFISGGATLTFPDLTGTVHSVVNGLIVS
jgi:hypothetical protein